MEILTKTKDKDYKHYLFQKQKYEKQIKTLEDTINEQKKAIAEKDKELNIQALKLKDLMSDND